MVCDRQVDRKSQHKRHKANDKTTPIFLFTYWKRFKFLEDFPAFFCGCVVQMVFGETETCQLFNLLR